MKRAAALSLMLLSACSQVPNINVRSTWGSNLGRLGIVPIYPPNEDRYPGDVLLYVQNPCDGVQDSPYIQSVFVDNIAAAQTSYLSFFARRPQLPETTLPQKQATGAQQQVTKTPAKPAKPAATPGAAPATPAAAPPTPATTAAATNSGTQTGNSTSTTQPTTGLASQPVAPDTDPIFWASRTRTRNINRLRLVAFPTLVLGSFTQAEASAAFPIASLFNLRLGGGVQRTTNITVTVSGTQEADVPQLKMRALAQNYLRDPQTRFKVDWGQAIDEVNARTEEMKSISGCKVRSESQAPQLVFINRVFYATEFDFDYGEGSAAAAQIQAAVIASASSAAASSKPTSAPAGSPGGVNSTPPSSDVTLPASEQMAANLLKSLSALAGGATPGGGATLAYGTNGSVVLKKTFDRPLAFGVDQTIFYDLSEALCLIGGGNVTESGCVPGAGSPPPTVRPSPVAERTYRSLVSLAAFSRDQEGRDDFAQLSPSTLPAPGPPTRPAQQNPCSETDLVCNSNRVKNNYPAPAPRRPGVLDIRPSDNTK